MESPKYEILNWNGEHLFSIGPPKTSGIKSYDYKRRYQVRKYDKITSYCFYNNTEMLEFFYQVESNDGRAVANLIQEGRTVTLNFDERESLHTRNKTLILAFGFILVVLHFITFYQLSIHFKL